MCLSLCDASQAQERQGLGTSIGKISTNGELIVLELNEGVLGSANLFDLAGRTLRFTPSEAGYRVQNLPLRWDADFGSQLQDADTALHDFSFPFSGKKWDSFSVGINGSIRFGPPQPVPGEFAGPAARQGGVSIGRFDQLAEAASRLINTVPAICVFLKPRMSGSRYMKSFPDHVVITWDLTEPWGNIQDFTWTKTTNRFQAALWQDGTIEMSYDQLAAKDAVVGLYPLVENGSEETLANLKGKEDSSRPAHLNLKNVKLTAVDHLFLKATFETRGAVLQEGNAALAGIEYRLYFGGKEAEHERRAPMWVIRGFAPPARSGIASRYVAFGPGVSRSVSVKENTISIEGILPSALRGVDRIPIYVEVIGPGSRDVPVDEIPAHTVKLNGLRNPEMDLSSAKQQDGPLPIVYESFHYLALPNPRDLTCTVINALGDNFDFLAYYSDFRVDNQEAGTPSTGPRGGNVSGIGVEQRGLESYCSKGRFQWQFVQPVYVGSNQMQEWPPEGAPVGNDHDITFYEHQLSERSSDGKIPRYDYALSQIGHEMGHRWMATATAKVKDEAIQLGPTHWARGLQAPAVFPYQRPVEASAMGGGVWQDNLDGTYTQLDDDYYVPATGWSHLDLYLMGLISAKEVPDFFILKNFTGVGKDANGHAILKADRTKITIQDVIAAEGPRSPDVDHAQKKFNTGFVLVVEHGHKPSQELIERANGIREAWIDYWATTTGHRSSMTAQSH
jgi:hypothetical protein